MKRNQTFVIVSGLSGSGKSTAIHILEDLGFYCVDNLPVTLLPKFLELFMLSEGEITRVAMGVDIRERDFLRDFPRLFEKLRQEVPVELLFLESALPVLLRRYSITRRRHPLAAECMLEEGIRREIEALGPVRAMADQIIDTGDRTVHDLKKLLTERYHTPETGHPINVTLISFGFTYGLPLDANIVLDVRFLPNPFFVEELRPLTGRNPKIRRYLLATPETMEFLERTEAYLDYLLPRYVAEGKSYLTVALGCTGGRHRSVFLVEELRRRLERRGSRSTVTHRDLRRTGK